MVIGPPKLKETIKLPGEVKVDIIGDIVQVEGPKGKVSRKLFYPGVSIMKEGNDIWIETAYPRKRQKAMLGTYVSHLKNMIKGVTEGFEYKLKRVYAHFPMSVKVAGDKVLIENFLGEKIPRKAQIEGNCEVTVRGDEVVITGTDIEEVSQTAANIEQATRVRRRDPRVFQDGIYVIEKNGVPV